MSCWNVLLVGISLHLAGLISKPVLRTKIQQQPEVSSCSIIKASSFFHNEPFDAHSTISHAGVKQECQSALPSDWAHCLSVWWPIIAATRSCCTTDLFNGLGLLWSYSGKPYLQLCRLLLGIKLGYSASGHSSPNGSVVVALLAIIRWKAFCHGRQKTRNLAADSLLSSL